MREYGDSSGTSRTSLQIISPVYREAEVIEQFDAHLHDELETLRDRYDITILYVADPSDDETIPVLRRIAEYRPDVRVILMSTRFGHQMALVAGMDHSDADACVMLDSDLQHPPALIPELVAHFESGCDVVFTIREESSDRSLLSRWCSAAYYPILCKLTMVDIVKSGADFRLLSRRVVRVFQTQIRERNQFLRGLVPWVGFRSAAVHYRASLRAGGTTKYSLPRSLKLAVDGIVSFSKRPLVASIAVGSAFATFGFLYGAWCLITYALGNDLPSGWTSLAAMMSILGGVQLVFLGVVGLYVGAIFDEVKGRPHYIVDEYINFEEAV